MFRIDGRTEGGSMIACIYHDVLSLSGYLIVASGAIAAFIAQPFRRR
jgi:hypothetical protein